MKNNNLGKFGIIGLGRMGRCLIEGASKAALLRKEDLSFTTRHAETAAKLAKDLGIRAAASNRELFESSDTIVLAVKPQNVSDVVGELKGLNSKGKTLISIAASVRTEQLEQALGSKVAVIRAMPNTPAFVGAGMTAICAGAHASQGDLDRARALFAPLGRVAQVDERHMDAVTGLSGCGPAYIYLILDALTEGGIKVGLPRELATELSAQTVLGAAKMLQETGRHPAALKDEVTTPAGCTIDGLVELEEGKLRITLIKAVVAATERAKTLSGSG
ncbi:MAG: pyrroline-5-carboxylate reductase [Bdellovibrionaceae bacterium]|nr:pyrroline-5-carboxylate reductase [Pseudobdellovibrionaceae bacterium]